MLNVQFEKTEIRSGMVFNLMKKISLISNISFNIRTVNTVIAVMKVSGTSNENKKPLLQLRIFANVCAPVRWTDVAFLPIDTFITAQFPLTQSTSPTSQSNSLATHTCQLQKHILIFLSFLTVFATLAGGQMLIRLSLNRLKRWNNIWYKNVFVDFISFCIK